jgi:hypothetical protein
MLNGWLSLLSKRKDNVTFLQINKHQFSVLKRLLFSVASIPVEC